MKSIILLCFIFILNIFICSSQETIQEQKTMLINTNLTKEELLQILSNESNNNTSIEEVESQMISDTETVIKNGKVKMKIKLEFDLNDAQNEKKAFIQTITPNIDEKISFFNCFLALGIAFILIGSFSLSLKMKRKNKFISNKYSGKKEYLLKIE